VFPWARPKGLEEEEEEEETKSSSLYKQGTR